MTNNTFKATQEQREFIFNNYIGIGNKKLTQLFNEKFNTNLKSDKIKAFKSRNKLDSGLDGRFKKGDQPSNKGKTWDEYMPKESQKNCRTTTFKKGSVPINSKDIGSEFIDDDGYLYIKVKATGKRFGRTGKWQAYHNLVWEQYNGVIPEGHVVLFLDRNKSNFDINNLKLVSRAELCILNKRGLIYQDSNLTNAGVSLAKLLNIQNKIKSDYR